jgi:PAS domain S-box-containing protein
MSRFKNPLSKLNPFLWHNSHPLLSYGLAVLSVGIALLLTLWPVTHLHESPVTLFLCAIMLTALFGGIGPGLLAVSIAVFVFDYFFIPPLHSFIPSANEIPRFLAFVFSSVFVCFLSVAQRSVTESLRTARDKLTETVSELRVSEEKIRQDERELRQIVDLTPQHVAVLGPELTTHLFASESALNYYGITLEEWQKADPKTFFHPDDLQLATKTDTPDSAEALPYERELRLRRRDGQYRWFLFRFCPLLDEQGQITRWYAAATDIEDRKLAQERLQLENVALREEIDSTSMFEEIVGSSPALQSVLSRVSKVAPTESTVLITGETGTGKELIARAIHRRSTRAERAFVSVNCAAIPRDLIASELFGHEKGAFTGAINRRLGRFELAGGGTIFLDEVGELPAETQIALLRVLQEHEFERVGGDQPIPADVRLLAATNRDLQDAIQSGAFRSDLFYRLNVFPIEMPALRERKEDIPILVGYFIDRYASKTGKKIRSIDKRTLDLLEAYAWPGNIRELQNVIERSVIVCESENFSVDESWLSRQPVQADSASQPLAEKLSSQERDLIETALAESKGKVSGPLGAAAKLGIPQSTLDSKIRSLGINKHRFK